jgi:hypothetical protein
MVSCSYRASLLTVLWSDASITRMFSPSCVAVLHRAHHMDVGGVALILDRMGYLHVSSHCNIALRFAVHISCVF